MQEGFARVMTGEGEILQAVQREPVVKSVHRELRRAILQGRFPPESRLVETNLAQLLNVSRTPVREAISKLESEGLVRRLKAGGVVVEDTAAKLSEVVLLRQCLEGAAVRLACERGTDAELAGIAAATEGALAHVQTAPVRTRSEQDRAFHMGIASAARSPRLMSLIEEFYEYSFSELMPQGPAADLDLLQRQHVAVADALLARDADAAEAAIRAHLETVLRIVRARISE